MSAHHNRNGAPIEGTVTTAGSVGSADQVYKFFRGETASGATLYVRPCLVSNKHTSAPILVKVNQEDAAADDFHFVVPGLTTVDVSVGGIVCVDLVSIFIPATAAYTDVEVHGWAPAN